MKKKYLLLISIFFALNLSFSQTSYTIIGATSGTNWRSCNQFAWAGQNITTTNCGLITNITVDVRDVTTSGTAELRLNSGTNTDTPSYTQSINVTSTGTLVIPLSTPFPVDVNSNYAFSLKGIGSTEFTIKGDLDFSGDVYTGGVVTANFPGGHSLGSTNEGDLIFSVDIAESYDIIGATSGTNWRSCNQFAWAGQNITTTSSGEVTDITIDVRDMTTSGTAELRLNSGTNTDTPSYTQSINVTSTGTLVIPLSTPFPVDVNSNYAFSLKGIGSTEFTIKGDLDFSGDVYTGGVVTANFPGGHSLGSTNEGDLIFSISVSECNNNTLSLVENSTLENLKVFPNPTSGEITIQFNRLQSNLGLEIFSINGRLMNSKNFNNTSLINLNLDSQPGIYIMVITNENREKNYQKIIKK